MLFRHAGRSPGVRQIADRTDGRIAHKNQYIRQKPERLVIGWRLCCRTFAARLFPVTFSSPLLLPLFSRRAGERKGPGLWSQFSLALALVGAIALPAFAHSAKTQPPVKHIVWLTPDATQVGQARVGFGVAEKMVKFVSSQLPEIEHTLVRANAKRSLQMLERGEAACHPSMIRSSERERIAYFSNTLLLPPMQLIARADKIESLPRDSQGAVDLSRLLADPSLRGALTERRSYGEYIDGIIAARPENKRVQSYSPGDFGGKLLQMLLADRADYLIDFPTSMDLVLNSMESRHEALQALPIQGANDFMVIGVACPRNAWGLEAIHAIDRVLSTPAGVALMRESSARLLRPEARRVCSAKQDAFYKERARPGKSF